MYIIPYALEAFLGNCWRCSGRKEERDARKIISISAWWRRNAKENGSKRWDISRDEGKNQDVSKKKIEWCKYLDPLGWWRKRKCYPLEDVGRGSVREEGEEEEEGGEIWRARIQLERKYMMMWWTTFSVGEVITMDGGWRHKTCSSEYGSMNSVFSMSHAWASMIYIPQTGC